MLEDVAASVGDVRSEMSTELVWSVEKEGMLGRFIVSIALLPCCGAWHPSTAGAQETINYASLGGRGTDPQGAGVPGPKGLVRQTETNLTAQTTTDGEGRFRFPYLKVGPYEIVIKQQ